MAKQMDTTEQQNQQTSKSRWIILLLLLLLLIAIGVTLWALFFREETVLTPDYAPPGRRTSTPSLWATRTMRSWTRHRAAAP